MKVLPRVLTKDKKQQGFRIRNELIEFLEKFVDSEQKRGNIISKNDVVESLIYELKEKYEKAN